MSHTDVNDSKHVEQVMFIILKRSGLMKLYQNNFQVCLQFDVFFAAAGEKLTISTLGLDQNKSLFCWHTKHALIKLVNKYVQGLH